MHVDSEVMKCRALPKVSLIQRVRPRTSAMGADAATPQHSSAEWPRLHFFSEATDFSAKPLGAPRYIARSMESPARALADDESATPYDRIVRTVRCPISDLQRRCERGIRNVSAS